MSKRIPGYLLHKPTGQARVRIAGRDHYLGVHGSDESRRRYDELITEYLKQKRKEAESQSGRTAGNTANVHCSPVHRVQEVRG